MPNVPAIKTATVTIANGQTASGELALEGYRIAGIIIPTGTEGATLGFEASDQRGGTFRTVHNGSGAVAITMTADTVLVIPKGDANDIGPLPVIKVTTSAAQSGADATLTLLLERV